MAIAACLNCPNRDVDVKYIQIQIQRSVKISNGTVFIFSSKKDASLRPIFLHCIIAAISCAGIIKNASHCRLTKWLCNNLEAAGNYLWWPGRWAEMFKEWKKLRLQRRRVKMDVDVFPLCIQLFNFVKDFSKLENKNPKCIFKSLLWHHNFGN